MSNLTKSISLFSIVAIGFVLNGPAFAAEVTIDGFTDPFAGEEFVGSYSNNTVGSTYTRHGLEVGYLYPGDGVDVGDPLPAVEEREFEIQNQSGLVDVLGGTRYGELAASPLSYSRVGVGAYNGYLSFSTAFGTQGILDLVYASDNGLNADFSTDDTEAHFTIELVSGDLHQPSNPEYNRPVPMQLTLISGLGTPDEVTETLSEQLLEEQAYSFAFSDFNSIDFSDVDSIGLHIDQSDPDLAAVDFSLSNFQAVSDDFPNIPEPATLGLLLAGLPLMIRRRKVRD